MGKSVRKDWRPMMINGVKGYFIPYLIDDELIPDEFGRNVLVIDFSEILFGEKGHDVDTGLFVSSDKVSPPPSKEYYDLTIETQCPGFVVRIYI
jgi:hypothetical protein